MIPAYSAVNPASKAAPSSPLGGRAETECGQDLGEEHNDRDQRSDRDHHPDGRRDRAIAVAEPSAVVGVRRTRGAREDGDRGDAPDPAPGTYGKTNLVRRPLLSGPRTNAQGQATGPTSTEDHHQANPCCSWASPSGSAGGRHNAAAGSS